MATSTSDTTGNSALAVRGNNILTAGLVSAAVAGSIIIGGGSLHFDTGVTTNPAIKTGTSAIIQSYDGQVATTFVNSGSRVNYTAASFINPFTGTQAILNFGVDVYKSGVTTNDISCAIGPPNFTNSGSIVVPNTGTFLLKHKAFMSGATLTASGNFMPTMIPPLWGGRCWTLVTPGPGIKAKIRIQTRDQYIP